MVGEIMIMNIFDEIAQANLPKGEFVVIGSSILDVLNIREAHDIDIAVSPSLFTKLHNRGWKEFNMGTYHALMHAPFDVTLSWGSKTNTPNLKELLSHATRIKSIPFISLEYLEQWKRNAHRPKDIIDLKLISTYKQTH